MISGERQKLLQKAARWPCGSCGRGIGSNSIQCTSCPKWVHTKCSHIKGSMYEVMRSFICRGCSNPVIGTCHTTVDIGASANLEVVDKLCYLGDMLTARRNFTENYVTCGLVSVLLRWHCNTLCAYHIMFAHNRPHGMRLMWHVLKMTHQGSELRAKYDVYDCLFIVWISHKWS